MRGKKSVTLARKIANDPAVSCVSYRIYGLFMDSEKLGTASVGHRRLASICRCSLRDIQRAVDALVGMGYIERLRVGNGQRGRYRIVGAEIVKPSGFRLQANCAICRKPISTLMCGDCEGRELLADAV